VSDLPAVSNYQLNNGNIIAWREWGSGVPLIMLHGWSMSSVVFSEVAEILATDFRVLCPDLPGHGQSDPSTSFSVDGCALALLEWSRLLGLESSHLLGWSLGGQVAIKLAADYGTFVDKLILIATTPQFCQTDDWQYGLPQAQVKALARNLKRAYEKTLGDFFDLQFVDEALPKDRYREILKFAVRRGVLPEVKSAYASLQALSQTDLRQLLLRIKQETLVMHGGQDQIIPLLAGNYLAENLSNARLFRFPDIGHAPFFSRPVECANEWRRFLNES